MSYKEIRDSFFLAATIEGRSEQTLALYENTLRQFEKYLETETPLVADSIKIRRFIAQLTKRELAKATIATHVKELNVFYNFLTSENYIETNPMKLIKAPKAPRCYPYVLSEEDVLKLLKVTKGKSFTAKRNYAMIIFFLDTGVRVSELCNINLDDISLATLTAKINLGKGGKDRVVHFSKDTAKALTRCK